MPTPVPVVLDVDTGVDDACALLLAALHPGLALRAVSCVGGNAPLSHVVRNTLTVLATCGAAEVPVAAGADRPLLEHARDARHVHGADGMADLARPAPDRGPDGRHAVELLRDVALAGAAAGAPVTLVPLAPMTNVALLARTHPEAFAALARVVFMGGGAQVSNATASAEFNVFHDPEAAAIVLDACVEHAVPVTMYGLDVFYRPRITRERAEALLAADDGTGPASLAGGLIRFMCDRFGEGSASIGDAGAVASVLAPEALTTVRLPVRVELSGTWTRGRTIVDLRAAATDLDHDPHGLAPALVDVALDIDEQRITALWLEAIASAVPATTVEGAR